MPLYEYQCDGCGHRFETIQKFSDPPLEQCPKCSGAVRKLQSAPAFQFKGAGWYITDYAKKDSANAEGAGKSEAPTPASDASATAGKNAGDSGAPPATGGANAAPSTTPASSAKSTT